MLDKIIDEVCYDDSEVAKEILSEVIENVWKNAEEGVVLVKGELNRVHIAVRRTGPFLVSLRNDVIHHLTMEVNHSSVSKVSSLKPSENTLCMIRKNVLRCLLHGCAHFRI